MGRVRLLPPEGAISSAVGFKPNISEYSKLNIHTLSNATEICVNLIFLTKHFIKVMLSFLLYKCFIKMQSPGFKSMIYSCAKL